MLTCCLPVTACPEGSYGPGCVFSCECGPGSLCDAVSGRCTCGPGHRGALCTEPCAEGTYGPGCIHACSCANGALCDAVTGCCQCTSGWFGSRCERGECTKRSSSDSVNIGQDVQSRSQGINKTLLLKIGLDP